VANKQQILHALQQTEQRLPVKTGELAKQLGAGENPKVLSVQLHRLAKEGFVKKKGNKSGWYITELGLLRLRIYRGQAKRKKLPAQRETAVRKNEFAKELDQEIEKNRDFIYGGFLKKGKGAATVSKESSRLVLNTAEYVRSVVSNLEDIPRVKEALDQFYLPKQFKQVWLDLWGSDVLGSKYREMKAGWQSQLESGED